MKNPKLSIIIVNYKSWAITTQAVASIQDSGAKASYEIILVDNDSGKSDVKELRKIRGITLIESGTNDGFGSGCNLGAAAAKGSFLLFLNPDTVIQAGTLDFVLDYAQGQQLVGVVGCKITFSNGQLQPSAHRKFPNLWSHFFEYTPLLLILSGRVNPYFGPTLYSVQDHNHALVCSHLLGAFMLVPRAVFRTVGGFDENFFLYREETDLCYRIQKAGYRILYTPGTTIEHTSGQSTHNDSFATLDPRYTASEYYFLHKIRGRHYTDLAYLLAVTGLHLSAFALRCLSAYKQIRRKPVGLSSQLQGKIRACLDWHKQYRRMEQP